MNILKAYSLNGKKVIDSREVAEMVERDHKALLKTIRLYSGYLGEGGSAPSDFFIPSTYINAQNKEMPCYLITKKGCDMIANKMDGEKGVLFTAAYVTAFDDMEKELKTIEFFPSNVSLNGLSNYLETIRRIMLESGDTPQAVREMAVKTLHSLRVPVPPALQHPAQMNLFSPDYPAIAGGEQA